MRFLALLAFLAVAWLSLASHPLPDPDLRKAFGGYDHLLMFAVFALICFVVWPQHRVPVTLWLLVIAISFEVIQLALPARAFGTQDLIANLAGVGLGTVLSYMVIYYRRTR